MARKLIHQFNIRFYEEDQGLLLELQDRIQEESLIQNDFLKGLLQKGLEDDDQALSPSPASNPGEDIPLEALLPLIRSTVSAAVREELRGLSVSAGNHADDTKDPQGEDPDATAVLDALDQQLTEGW